MLHLFQEEINQWKKQQIERHFSYKHETEKRKWRAIKRGLTKIIRYRKQTIEKYIIRQGGKNNCHA